MESNNQLPDEEVYDGLEEEKPEEEVAKRSVWFRLLRVFIALILVVSLIYLSGFREYLFFSRTSPQPDVAEMEPVLEVEKRQLPLRVIMIRETTLGTQRDKAEIRSLVNNASQIVSQAGIDLQVQDIITRRVNKERAEEILDGSFHFLEELNREMINVVLVRKLEGPNGVAYSGSKVILIADYTAGQDYRTLAHEVGHLLGLGHRENSQYIMSQGASGRQFGEDEVSQMRNTINEEF